MKGIIQQLYRLYEYGLYINILLYINLKLYPKGIEEDDFQLKIVDYQYSYMVWRQTFEDLKVIVGPGLFSDVITTIAGFNIKPGNHSRPE